MLEGKRIKKVNDVYSFYWSVCYRRVLEGVILAFLEYKNNIIIIVLLQKIMWKEYNTSKEQELLMVSFYFENKIDKEKEHE